MSVRFVPSMQALLQHMRTKHNHRQSICAYIVGSDICPSCGTLCNSRLRVIKDLSDSIRTKCSSDILNGSYPLVEPSVLNCLEEADRSAKRLALRDGHTSVPAVGQAQSADGRKVGRAQR